MSAPQGYETVNPTMYGQQPQYGAQPTPYGVQPTPYGAQPQAVSTTYQATPTYPPPTVGQPQVVVYDDTAPVDVAYSSMPANPPPSAAKVGRYIHEMEKAVRMGFIRKVYGILGIQLAITFGIVCLFSFSDGIRDGIREAKGQWPVWLALGITLFIALMFGCCPQTARKYPGNYIFLGIFTLAEGYLVGAIAAAYDPRTVLLAMGGVAGITLALTLFAWQTKWDFTICAGGMVGLIMSVLIVGIFAAITRDRIAYTIYAGIGMLVYSVFLVVDTQMVIGGKHRVQFGIDDYVFAALNLYLDIIQLFLFLLRILGSKK